MLLYFTIYDFFVPSELYPNSLITFDVILLQAYVYYAKQNNNTNSKGLKAIYKKYCADVIKKDMDFRKL